MNIFDMPVHPAADIFPMMSDDELDELAADIKAKGLLHPIAVKDGQVVDGRNRREACRRAGIKEPQVEDLNGLDPVAYVLSANINRRNLTKGQRAMAVAKLYPDPEKRGRGNKSLIIKEFNSGSVSQARTVLRWTPEVAEKVMSGTKPLNEAYRAAQLLKDSTDTESQRLDELRVKAPDLAAMVDDGQLSLVEAEAACGQREEEKRRDRHVALELINGLERMQDVLANEKQRASIVARIREQPDDQRRVRAQLTAWITNLTATMEALDNESTEAHQTRE